MKVIKIVNEIRIMFCNHRMVTDSQARPSILLIWRDEPASPNTIPN